MMVREYIVLAAGCVAVGIVVALVMLVVTARLGINITDRNIWILAIPAVVAIVLNVLLVEVYRGRKKK